MGYVEDFENLGFGLFVHFGLYSIVGKGEWYLHLNPQADANQYEKLIKKFDVKKEWAKELVEVAKQAGCKYINITTRHHDGFSLYDTLGLNDYDAPHSASGRDLIKEFVDECNKQDIVPFFYHTLLDWRESSYKDDFSAYIDYLVKSVEILCTKYGKIGGIFFDGMWDKPNDNWQEDRIYGTIRANQPNAIIINNTGLYELGKVGHKEIDSVAFERGKPFMVDSPDKHRAGEMSQILNDHWGYAENDCNYKSFKELVENLVDCRKCNCNFLLNTGLQGDGSVSIIDKNLLSLLGKWIRTNKNFIYKVKASKIKADNADILYDGEFYYAIIKDVPMSADPNVQQNSLTKKVKIYADAYNGEWLDNGYSVDINNGEFFVLPFEYGESMSVRVMKFSIR